MENDSVLSKHEVNEFFLNRCIAYFSSNVLRTVASSSFFHKIIYQDTFLTNRVRYPTGYSIGYIIALIENNDYYFFNKLPNTLIPTTIRHVILRGKINLLRVCFEKIGGDIADNYFIFETAVKYGQIECLDCLRNYSKKWDNYIFMLAIQYNQFEVFKFAHENGYEYNSQSKELLLSAIHDEKIEILTYMYNTNMFDKIYWDSFVLQSLVSEDQSKCLQLFLQHGMYNSQIYNMALLTNSLKCLKVLIDHNVPWDCHLFYYVVSCASDESFLFLVKELFQRDQNHFYQLMETLRYHWNQSRVQSLMYLMKSNLFTFNHKIWQVLPKHIILNS